MTPVSMIVEHHPPESYGDCFRACVASLLDLPAAEVPHFNDLGDEQSQQQFIDRVTAFLRPRGLYPLAVWVRPVVDDKWIDCLRGSYVLCGIGKSGVRHCIVASGRYALVHDPNPDVLMQGRVTPVPDEGGAGYWLWLFVRLL